MWGSWRIFLCCCNQCSNALCYQCYLKRFWFIQLQFVKWHFNVQTMWQIVKSICADLKTRLQTFHWFRFVYFKYNLSTVAFFNSFFQQSLNRLLTVSSISFGNQAPPCKPEIALRPFWNLNWFNSLSSTMLSFGKISSSLCSVLETLKYPIHY